MRHKNIHFFLFLLFMLLLCGCQTNSARYEAVSASSVHANKKYPFKFYLKDIQIICPYYTHDDLKNKENQLKIELLKRYPHLLSEQQKNTLPVEICIKQKNLMEELGHLSAFASFFTLGLVPNIRHITGNWEIQVSSASFSQKKDFTVKMKSVYSIGILGGLFLTHAIPAPIENYDIKDQGYNFSLLPLSEQSPAFLKLFHDTLIGIDYEKLIKINIDRNSEHTELLE